MRKQLFSAALVLLLILLLAPTARADMNYSDPAPVTSGHELDYLAATTDPASTVELSGVLPAGVELVTEIRDGLQYVYLRGIPTAAGVYTYVLTIGESAYTHTLTVNPAVPTVTACADLSCYPNETVQVAVSASVEDGGSLSYQWYTNTIRSNSGGALISDATGPIYQPGTAYVGTNYYYCLVTNASGGMYSSVTSAAIAVTVEELSVDSIYVAVMPAKTQYTVGDTLDTAGLQIGVRYSNGSEQLLTSGFGTYPVRLDSVGDQTITVNYLDKSCSFTVKVSEAPEVIQGIGVLTLPVKTEYVVGESLDASGLSIRVYTNNGQRDVSGELLACEPLVLNSVGTQTITVSYGGKTCTFSVTVREEEHLESIAIARAPDKLSYQLGELLDTAGLRLTLIGSEGSKAETDSGFTCSPTRLTTAGRQQITVSYGSLTTHFYVTVIDASPSPSPTASPAEPGPSAEPDVPNLLVTPAPGATVNPHVTQHESHSSGLGTSLVSVIVIAALLALAVLAVYVYIANRGGFDAAVEKLQKLLDRFRKK